MALIEKNREPTPNELRIFGLLLAAFGGLLGGLVLYQAGLWPVATAIWITALLLCIFYYAVPSARRMIFHAYMAVVYPIGWLVSHALLVSIYYLVLTPIGLAMRLGGRDPMQRSLDRSATTYWTPHRTRQGMGRYFQQF